MGDNIINVILNVLGELEIGIMMCWVFCVPITKKKPFLVLGLLFIIMLCVGGWKKDDDIFISAFGLLISPTIWILWTEGKWFRRLAIYVCSMMYPIFLYFCIDFMFSVVSGKSVEMSGANVRYQFLRGILTITIAVVLANILRRKVAGYKEIVSSLPTGYFIVGGVCVLAASMVQNFVESISRGYESVRLANIISVCVIIVSIMFYALGVVSAVLDIFRKRYKEESILKEKYLQIAKNYIRTVRNNAKETRKIRHDMQSHMNILSHHLEHGEYRKAQTYLSQMQSNMDEAIRKTISVNHEIVDAVLFQKQSESEELDIQWEFEGILPTVLPIGDFDLCTIFSNLLSNSIEACRQVEEDRRYIHLEIRHLEENLVIEIENPSNRFVKVGELGSVTSKKDIENHGYGILNIRDAVRKNHGELVFESTENKFVARIVFHLSGK